MLMLAQQAGTGLSGFLYLVHNAQDTAKLCGAIDGCKTSPQPIVMLT